MAHGFAPWDVAAGLIAFPIVASFLPAGTPASVHRRARARRGGIARRGVRGQQGQLIAARAAQGLGAAIISPAALSILTTTFSDGAERNKALGAWGAVGGAAGAVGVLLGGVLTEGLGWEWCCG
jgi:MFS family permease